jgi:nicotinate-nucleotide adenylyltransferase
MKVGILGGGFNPMHLAHFEMAKQALEVVDNVWIMPCYSHSYGKEMESSLHRTNMCLLTTKLHPKIKVNTYEIYNKLENGTYDMLAKLIKDFKDIEFYFILGQDNADSIHKWKNNEEIRKLLPFIVIPRNTQQSEENWYKQSPHIYLKDAKIPNISSTEVRKRVIENQDLEGMIDNFVLDYIKKGNLYGFRFKA